MRTTLVSRYQNANIQDFIGARIMEVVVTTGTIYRRVKFQSNHHHQQTNTQLFCRPDALPVAKPTVSEHWREKCHILCTFSSQAHLRSSNLVATTKGSWLPLGRIANPLVSPLTPVPQCMMNSILTKIKVPLCTILIGSSTTFDKLHFSVLYCHY